MSHTQSLRSRNQSTAAIVSATTKCEEQTVVRTTSYQCRGAVPSQGFPHSFAWRYSVGRVPPNIRQSTSIGAVTCTETNPRAMVASQMIAKARLFRQAHHPDPPGQRDDVRQHAGHPNQA